MTFGVVTPPRKSSVLVRGLTLIALTGLLAFIGTQVRVLWREYGALRVEREGVSKSAVIGFHNVSLNPSYARRPANWFHDEGESTLLWSGWKDGVGHRWFRVGQGELDQSRIWGAWGRDYIRPIDHPIVEIGDGTIWRRIPDTEDVAGQNLAGVWSVYPLLLLKKVQVVNDSIGETPFLVTFNPFVPRDESVTIYDPVSNGQRLTMGMSGYFLDRKPLLFDRGTESFWIADDGVLRAIAGPQKGASLPRVGRPTLASWSECRARYPGGRLIVGANRDRPTPEL